MAYDDRAQALAARKLAPKSAGGKGQAVTISATAASTYNPTTGRATAGAPSTQACSGIEEAYRASLIDGALIKTGDKRFMLSPLKTDGTAITLPEAGHTLTYADGTAWVIMAVEPFKPAGLLVYAYLQLRRA
ncbi:MAG: hypothetical protein HY859_09565 [Caulobacterales bacterium]|nr:hypothetical protein [Caulobacterales bacterium]